MQVVLDANDLAPVISTIVEQVIAKINGDADPQRLAYSEREAGELLGVKPSTLRDERLKGRLHGSRVGRRIRYSKADLLNYLAARRWEPK